MKKVVIILIIAIVIVVGFVSFKFFKGSNKKDNNATTDTTTVEPSYGKRGNITETQRIKFLSKNDEYLVGMIGLPVSTEPKAFTNDEMIRFALNIAIERYSTMLSKKKTKNVSGYVIDVDTVNEITEEFFGIASVPFDKNANPYYSVSNKAFVFDESIEKTLYYYPVTQTNLEDGSVEIIADAIYISDTQNADTLEKAKYEGKYGEENVDNTIKFVFNGNGKLISYQHLQ